MKKAFPAIIVLSLALLVVWQLFFSSTNYYLVCAVILILSMLPFILSFERSQHTAREITLISSLVALAVVSRAVFYLVPQIKPIAAVVGISGVCLGAKRGYLTGALSMFISNFIFGQGIWTAFQMVGMGLVGLVFGLVFKKVRVNRLSLAAAGFVSVMIFYGPMVDLASVLFLSNNHSLKSIVSVFAAGMPFNAVFAAVTAVFLFLFGESFIKKINRITVKYGICEEKYNEE